MPTNVTNWLLRRGAGALFNLQRTPYVAGTDAITANPKKTQANQVHDHTRQYLTNWPASSVFKISGAGLTINGLELDTRFTYKTGGANPYHHDNTDQLWLDIAITVQNSGTQLTSGAPVIWPTYFGGSDYSLYNTAEWFVNVAYQEDKDGDGTPEDYYEVFKANVSTAFDSSGLVYFPCTTAYYPDETSEMTGTYTAAAPPQFPDVTIYANFGTTKKYALDALSAATLSSPSDGASFCARHPDDSAHGLASFIIKQGNVPYVQNPSGYTANVGIIGSYRHASTDSPAFECLQADCECKFFYTPDACDDCWYAGKTVTIDITYKQIQFTDNGPSEDGVYLTKSVTKGSATTHSTVTKTLTLPTGLTRQQVGSTFTVPTLAGYAVVIDDIKLVSVS